jgi:hypothetical protein
MIRKAVDFTHVTHGQKCFAQKITWETVRTLSMIAMPFKRESACTTQQRSNKIDVHVMSHTELPESFCQKFLDPFPRGFFEMADSDAPSVSEVKYEYLDHTADVQFHS